MVASLILLMHSFFQILIFNKMNNLSLGFIIGKLAVELSSILLINLNLGFRIGIFRDGGLLNIAFGFFSLLPKKN